jgi:hypothetical protein
MTVPDQTFDPAHLLGDDYQRRLEEDISKSRVCIRSVVRGLFGSNPDGRFLGENLIRVAEEELYRLVGFNTFCDWALGLQPDGLQLRDSNTAKRLRRELIDVGLHGAWAAVLPHIVRGNQLPKRLVQNDNFNRFFPPDGSDTGIDRRIMKLYKSHFEIYERLIKLEISLKEAVNEAGIVRPSQVDPLRTLMLAWKKAPRETRETFRTLISGPDGFS